MHLSLSVLFVSLLLLQAGSAPAQTAQKAFEVGPKVGQSIPQFRLADQNGTFQTLSSLKGQNGLVLVFFRSADW